MIDDVLGEEHRERVRAAQIAAEAERVTFAALTPAGVLAEARKALDATSAAATALDGLLIRLTGRGMHDFDGGDCDKLAQLLDDLEVDTESARGDARSLRTLLDLTLGSGVG